ncbi:putative 3-hydroxyacyl-CoA dehydrogenase [Aspergillus ibericus CBS 121593]|uniref:Putative 3-hydroxyacyl-CoA dehydrogenase n=1 Tax=Aspergillus ibericus CBS 121593 TaxID=1448316 RepID=A0A395GVK9_9EURO|nr:putative 3-hydroxyacyl-CoA dehydrogenase [Aspergillus ibericus CBS 121593]RAK98123.1 putative 3-hydroxyacyl-CoA dehydrogenase [Aspergillus ibericus CBS 121593]
MARFDPEPILFYGLNDKVVVLTGGAHGIGAATVSLLYENGAHVVFGDRDGSAANVIEERYRDRVHFVHTNVSNYSSVLNLFKVAYSKHGRIDHAFAIAGISEQTNWFHPGLNLESIETIPEPSTLNVDLLGTIYFARIAAVYLRQGVSSEEDSADKSLILVSSIAGFTESPGMPLYCAAKHGVLGLMRALRPSLPASHGISVSAVCPWMSATGMVDDIQDAWQRAGLPMNQPSEVAQIIVGLAAVGEEGNGKTIYVEGGRGWDIEAGLDDTREIWMGKSQSQSWLEGQKLLMAHPGSAAYWASKATE